VTLLSAWVQVGLSRGRSGLGPIVIPLPLNSNAPRNRSDREPPAASPERRIAGPLAPLGSERRNAGPIRTGVGTRAVGVQRRIGGHPLMRPVPPYRGSTARALLPPDTCSLGHLERELSKLSQTAEGLPDRSGSEIIFIRPLALNGSPAIMGDERLFDGPSEFMLGQPVRWSFSHLRSQTRRVQ
jgi:hypothetical protein